MVHLLNPAEIGRKVERKKERSEKKLIPNSPSFLCIPNFFFWFRYLLVSGHSFSLFSSFSLSYPSTLFLPLSGTITQVKSQVFETHPIHASLSLFTSCRFCNFWYSLPFSLSLFLFHSLHLSIEGGKTWKHGFKTQEKNHRERPIVIEWERRAEH